MVSFVSFLQRLFHKKAIAQSDAVSIEEAICLYVVSFFTDPELGSHFTQRLEHAQKATSLIPISPYVEVYSAIEHLLAKSSLPDVSSVFTVEELRAHLSKKFATELDRLPLSFYLVFQTGQDQTLLLYGIGLQVLCQLFTKTVGFPLFQHTVLLHQSQKCLNVVRLGEGTVEVVLPTVAGIKCTEEELRSAFNFLYKQLYTVLEIDLGEKAARDLFDQLKQLMRESYGPDLVSKFETVLPHFSTDSQSSPSTSSG